MLARKITANKGNQLNDNPWIKLLLVPLASAIFTAGATYGLMGAKIERNDERVTALEGKTSIYDNFVSEGPRLTSDKMRDYVDHEVEKVAATMGQDVREIRTDVRDINRKLDEAIKAHVFQSN